MLNRIIEILRLPLKKNVATCVLFAFCIANFLPSVNLTNLASKLQVKPFLHPS